MKRNNEYIRDLKIGLFFGAFSAVVFLLGVMAVTYHGSDPAQGVLNSVRGSRSARGIPEQVSLNSAPASRNAWRDPTAGLPRTSPALSTGVESSTGVPVLCYHYLRERTTPLQFLKILGALLLNLPLIDDMDLWTQTAPAFERQMAYLASEGYETVDLDDLARWRRGQTVLPRKPIVITFDDGDRSVLDIAYPILDRYGFKATIFVVTSKVGEKWERVDCLDWDELKMMETSGVFSVQSHSHDLHRKVAAQEMELPLFVAATGGYRAVGGFPGGVGDGRGVAIGGRGATRGGAGADTGGLRMGIRAANAAIMRGHPAGGGRTGIEIVYEDLRRSRQAIEDHLGTRPRYLAWPYGFGDGALDSTAVAAGFDGLCTLRPGMNDPYAPARPDGGSAVWLTEIGSLAPELCVAFNWTRAGSAAPPGAEFMPERRIGGWGALEIKRFTITARTSIRTFKQMLSGE